MQPSIPEHSMPLKPGASVLLVDDEPEVLDDMASILTRNFPGLGVSTAESGRWALELLGTQCCEVILSDYRMRGGMNGAEFLRQASVICPHAARVAMAGDPDEYLVAQGQLHGFTVLAKPISVALLLQIVGHHVRV